MLSVHRNAVVWTVFISPFISKSFSQFTNPLGIASIAPITISTTVTFMFESFIFFFFCSIAKSRYLSLFSLSFNFTHWFVVTATSTILQVLFSFFFFFRRLSLEEVVRSRLGYPYVSENLREFYASHSPGQILGCAYATCSYGQI